MSLGGLVRRVALQDELGKLATITTVGPSNAVDVNVVQTAGGGGTEYTEGDDTSTPITGVALIANQKDSDIATAVDAGTTDGTGIEMALYVRPLQGDPSANRGQAILQLASAPSGEDVSTTNPVPILISDGTDVADVLDLASSNPLAVAIVDGSGAQIASFGGGTQYTEGDVDATITGTATLMEVAANELRPLQGTVADGLLVNLGANNDISGTVTANAGTGTFAVSAASLPLPTGAATAALQTQPGVDIGDVTINNAAGASAVNIQDGGNSITVDAASLPLPTGASTLAEQQTQTTSLQLIDDVVFTDDTSTHSTGNTKGVGIMAAATPTDAAVNANDIGMLAMSVNRELHVLPRANSGVDIGDVDVTSVTPGSGATNLGKAEDAAHTSGDVGVMALAVRNDNGATTFGANGDYCPIAVSSNGSLFIGSVVPGTTATQLGKAEDAAHASGDAGVMALGVRNTANSTLAGTDGDYAPLATDIMSGVINGVRRSSNALTAINTTYNTTATETNSSASVDCSMFRRGSFNAIVTETGAAADITFTLQFSNDGGTTWFDYRVGPWVKYRFDDATIAAHDSGQLKICEPFECVAPTVRMTVTATGLLSGTNEFVVANATFELVN